MYNLNMSNIRFEWDENKAAANKEKHGICFEEASTVFLDENAILFDDPDHSHDEDRFILIGLSNRLNILMVCHCYRKDDETIRIISARKATRNEKKYYNEVNR